MGHSSQENTSTTPAIEPWVDAKTVGEFIGFEHDHVRKLANAGKLPGAKMQNGKKTYWRFKLSQVEEYMRRQANTNVCLN
jgi:excisionase family DNA binding protein